MTHMVFDEDESFWDDFWTRHSELMSELIKNGMTESEAKEEADKQFELID